MFKHLRLGGLRKSVQRDQYSVWRQASKMATKKLGDLRRVSALLPRMATKKSTLPSTATDRLSVREGYENSVNPSRYSGPAIPGWLRKPVHDGAPSRPARWATKIRSARRTHPSMRPSFRHRAFGFGLLFSYPSKGMARSVFSHQFRDGLDIVIAWRFEPHDLILTSRPR